MRSSRDRHSRAPVDHGKGRPRSLTTPRRGVPSARPRGLLVALAVHVVALAFVILATSVPRWLASGGATGEPPLTVTWVTADALTPGVALAAGSDRGPDVAPTPRSVAPFAPSPGMRAFDTSRIRARESDLFPLLTSRLTFLDELRRSPPKGARSSLTVSLASASPGDLPPLILTRPALDALVDAAWSRRERWRNFQSIARAVDAHHPDEGDLPALVRFYAERNLLQPYHEAPTPDARFWVILGMAADHRDVLDFVTGYARRHPSSRTTTELLFLIDELVEASHDAFNLLRLTTLDRLVETARLSPPDLVLARNLQAAWDRWAEQHRVASPAELDTRTNTIRASILSAIIATSPGGYGANDARFLAGRMAWRHDHDAAVVWWREMGRDERDGFARARGVIAEALGDDGSVDATRIDEVLAAEDRRWLAAAAARLARFGHTPRTF